MASRSKPREELSPSCSRLLQLVSVFETHTEGSQQEPPPVRQGLYQPPCLQGSCKPEGEEFSRIGCGNPVQIEGATYSFCHPPHIFLSTEAVPWDIRRLVRIPPRRPWQDTAAKAVRGQVSGIVRIPGKEDAIWAEGVRKAPQRSLEGSARHFQPLQRLRGQSD